jgi:hypothetical protein
MALEKIVEVDLVEVVGHNVVQVRTATKIFEDGKELSVSFHRHAVEPGQDYSTQAEKVKAICAAVHTPQAIAEYQAYVAQSLAAREAERATELPVAPTPSA